MGMTAKGTKESQTLVQLGQVGRCPECSLPLSEESRAQHLVTAHGYLSISGNLLPRAAGLTCLWDRVFATGDAQAHQRVWQLLENEPQTGLSRPPYVAALEAELLGRLGGLRLKQKELTRLIKHLRTCEHVRPYFWYLLSSEESRVRNLGRELLYPEVAESFVQQTATSQGIRDLLERLCPAEDIWDKIRVCQRLAHFTSATDAIKDCLHHLQQDRPVACPECGTAVPQVQLENHLRRTHHIYQFQGVRHSLEEMTAALLTALRGPSPDPRAWEALEALAREEYGLQAGPVLAARLGHTIVMDGPADKREAIHALSEVIVASELAPQVALGLASASESGARWLALSLAARLPTPLPLDLVAALKPLLARKRAPGELQIAAAAALLKTTGKDEPAASAILDALLARCGKGRSVERLRQLDLQLGSWPLIIERRAQIEKRIRMRCPRCHVQLRRPEMTRHLWTEHSLLLDGRRIREPWRLVEEWIQDYRRSNNPELLVRCRALGPHLDPSHGFERVCRMFVANGIADLEARHFLLEEARKRHASLCPHCFALVAIPEETAPRPLNESHGRISFDGYSVEVAETGLVPLLSIARPLGTLYRGVEPGRWLSLKGAMLFWAGLPVLAALALALLHVSWRMPPYKPVVLMQLLSPISYLSVAIYWHWRPRPIDRAIDYAWTWLLPALEEHELTAQDTAFMTGLALTSRQRGQPEARARILAELIKHGETAVAANQGSIAQLAALWALHLADAATVGVDGLLVLADHLGRCFEGKLPFSFAQQILAALGSASWTVGNRARLRVLVCDRAFEAGLEVEELLEVGREVPTIGDCLQIEDADGLARLRLLWSMRAPQPWDHWTRAATVFEIAKEPRRSLELLEKHPDLLLAEQRGDPLLLCGSGIVAQQILFKHMPSRIEIKIRRHFDKTQYEVLLGEWRLHFLTNPAGMVNRFERWCRYLFNEFLPQVEGVFSWKAPEESRPLHFQQRKACPECGRTFLTRVGGAGTPIG
jgi:hypothetical protein